jgi:hypothetical protein
MNDFQGVICGGQAAPALQVQSPSAREAHRVVLFRSWFLTGKVAMAGSGSIAGLELVTKIAGYCRSRTGLGSDPRGPALGSAPNQ